MSMLHMEVSYALGRDFFTVKYEFYFLIHLLLSAGDGDNDVQDGQKDELVKGEEHLGGELRN